MAWEMINSVDSFLRGFEKHRLHCSVIDQADVYALLFYDSYTVNSSEGHPPSRSSSPV